MPLLRRILLTLFALLPLVTLVHKNDLHRWDINRTLMNAPDEFSYMLTADALLHGPHLSTQSTLGIDTFYPPGYSLLLALWARLFGLTPFSAHVLNILLLSAATLVVYLFSKRLLLLLDQTPSDDQHLVTSSPRHLVTPSTLALLIAGIFAANWHVLEGALYVLSEPAFILATLAWLTLALKWPDWHASPRKTLAVAALAIAAWSIRGAGIVCIAVTFLYPCTLLLKSKLKTQNSKRETQSKIENRKSKIVSIALILALALAYQLTITLASPSKSLVGADSAAHSYPRQLLDGLTQRGRLHLSRPADWPYLAQHVGQMALSHLDDYAASLMPPFREPPDLYLRYSLSLLLGALALLGFLHHLAKTARTNTSTHVLDLYILAYFALYLLWPFNNPRFWAPILPIMLVYLVNPIRHFCKWDFADSPIRPLADSPPPSLADSRRPLAALLLALLLLLSLEELVLQLGFYQRRLNLVSDALAHSAATVVHASPDPQRTLIAVAGSTEHFVFAWYLPRVPGETSAALTELRSPKPPEHVEELLLRCLADLHQHPDKRLFVIKYFTDVNYADVFENLRQQAPNEMRHIEILRLYQNENITTVWELRAKQNP